ncbi:hypothetical protein Slin15195_G111550 [Septoria linicola]|uniref:DUF7730 domain-containing protein n=1 Tax=Septoria linicola TaxID=215465 RepID=A0A9Q9B7J3_9PEZI|nr:hypothetical protein Slin15195_G111550 [Septoria linicola]
MAIRIYASSREEHRVDRYWEGVAIEEVISGFPEALLDFDIPLVVKAANSLAKTRWAVSADGARVFLLRWLEPPRKGAFRFLDLSAELRNRIYEMVFKFPEPELDFCGIGYEPKLALVSREDQKQVDSDLFLSANYETAIDAACGGNLLALFRVNKQIYQEAKSQLLGINTFHFNDLPSAHQVFSLLSAEDMKHLRSLHIVIGSSRMLSEVAASLQHLALKRLRAAGKKRRIREFKQIPDLKEFAVLAQRAEEVDVYAESDEESSRMTFKDFLMTKPKARSKKRT